ncbi:hypothetical protein QEE_2244 [Clostridioides difficile CD113]|nr:hypothetical protein QEE_2244 [Clostridioides difficile CD113]
MFLVDDIFFYRKENSYGFVFVLFALIQFIFVKPGKIKL